MALGTITQTTAGSYNGTIGGGTATIFMWGGGGAGGGATGTKSAGGGGAGGAYVVTPLSMSSGTYPYIVGAGGAGGTLATTPPGGSTWFATVGSAYAPGGIGGTRSTGNNLGSQGGAGGTTGAIGTLAYAGGNGANGVGGTAAGATGGGGGGGASDSGVGGNASGATGGTGANTGGGHGGNGRGSAGGAGIVGTAIGGGGGGAFSNNTTDRIGGSGGDGKISIVYTLQESPTTALNTPSDTATGVSTTPTLNFTGTDANNDTVEYNVQVDTVNTFDSQGSTDTIAFDAASASAWSDASPLTWSHTVGSGSNRYLVVGATMDSAAGSGGISAVTFNSVAMTKVREDVNVSGNLQSSIWVLQNPDSGAHTISVTFDDTSGNCIAGAVSYTGVTQSTTVDSATGTTGTGTGAKAFNVTTVANNAWVFGVISTFASASLVVDTPTKTSRWSTNHTSTSACNGQDSNAAITPGGTAVSIGWTIAGTSPVYAMSGISLSPASTTGPLINAVSTTDAGFTAGHPFASGAAKDYTTQITLANSTTYYWRVRAIDPTGSNAYGAWATTRSFTTDAGGGGATIPVSWRSLLGTGF